MRTLFATFFAFAILLPSYAFAATAVVSIHTGNEEINAVEGIVVLPDGVHVDTVSPGNSVVSIWISPPMLSEQSVTFSGITPGGFSGTYPVLTITGDFSAEDIAQTRFESVTVLRNDGLGTPGATRMSIVLTPAKFDTESPEAFTPTIARDPSIFDGEYFLVFATQDKGSGIVRYEVREGSFGSWIEAESPYLLKNQRLTQTVYVKAIDNSGNERIAKVEPMHYMRWEYYLFIAILIVLALGAFIYKRQWQKFTQ